jgi:hypothetical protein
MQISNALLSSQTCIASLVLNDETIKVEQTRIEYSRSPRDVKTAHFISADMSIIQPSSSQGMKLNGATTNDLFFFGVLQP